jgi:glycosyltransferase involved in cell wall biosynthesis
MVAPSRQENLSNTIMESMACGTPVVAFDIGGNGDMVEHQINGYLARPFDPIDLACGIDWVLKDKSKHDELCKGARQKILSLFEEQVVIPKYIQLYESVL